MKRVILLLAIVFSIPGLLAGQSTLTFARVIDAAEMQSVGIAVVNPAPVSAPVTFTLFGLAGETVATASLSVPASGQVARLAGELFPNASAGWVQAASTVAGLRGFWLFGNFTNFGDAAEAATPASELIVPLISDLSEVSLMNTGSAETAVLLRLYSQEGRELAEPVVRVLAPRGAFRSIATGLFDPPDWSIAGHVAVTSSGSLAGSVVVRNFRIGPTLVALNAVGVGTASPDLVFPHVVDGRLGSNDFVSVISVTNPTVASQAITLTFTPETGLSPQSARFTLAPNATLRMSSDRLFGFFTGYQAGWVRVTSPQGLIGAGLSLDNEAGGSTATPGVTRSQTSLIFGHIANQSPWWTGFALVNPGAAPAIAEIIAVDPGGRAIGTANVEIPASGKVTRLLNEWIPSLQSRTSDGGFIFVRCASPLHGLALFFTRDVRIISSVPALDLAPTITFNPRP